MVARFDIDTLFDYRARRPALAFDGDHYATYDAPRLEVRRLTDAAATPYLLLTGPEPDYRWEGFTAAVHRLVEHLGVRLVVGLGAVPMGVPHTRPVVLTAHATRPDLVDRPNIWSGRLTVPASAQALLELRLGEAGRDAMGYVAHVPHYVAAVEFPAASVALLEAAGAAAGLTFDLDSLRDAARSTVDEVDRQVAEQDGQEVLTALEEQYDAFSRGAGQSMLAHDEDLPSADQLGQQFEQFLAGLDHREGRD
ncbi:PAC2 family protein [soil metagenome]